MASPPVAAHELDPCDFGDPPPVEPDFGALQSGIGLHLIELPSLSLHPVFSIKSRKNSAEMSLHVAEMLQKDAIELVQDGSPGFYVKVQRES